VLIVARLGSGRKVLGGLMSASLSFAVARWAVWHPGADSMIVHPPTASERGAIPSAFRRRVTAIGRKALEAAWAILPADGQPRLVLSSRHGEYQRTFGLLTSLAEEGVVSPAEFSLSVHHALVGLLSIATANRSGHTAIAAGPHSFGYGLLEAAACVIEDGGPVLLLHFDEPLPDIYDPIIDANEPPLVLAALLVPAGGGAAMSLAIEPEGAGSVGRLAHEFIEFLQSGEAERSPAGWRWRRAA